MKGIILGVIFLTINLLALGQYEKIPMRDTPLPDNMDTVNCVITPGGNVWDVEIGWSSADIISNHVIPLVGDLNGDEVPEILCCTKNGDSHIPPYRYNNELIVFDGFTKHVKAVITLPENITANDGAPYGLIKLANGKGLIVVACCDFFLRAYDITNSSPSDPYWKSDLPFGSEFGDWAVNLGFADFNHDGIPEVYVRDKIYNAENGKLLARANCSNTGSSYAHWSHETKLKLSSPIAADLYGDEDLELVLGNEIYSVEINNINGHATNNIMLVKTVTPPAGVPVDGHPQVADYNKDGHLDVFISVRDVESLTGTVYGYVWDVYNDVVSEPLIIGTEASGKSLPFVGDIDNDDLMEVLIQCGPESGVVVNGMVIQSRDYIAVRAYKYNPVTRTFTFMWDMVVRENSFSNGITAFDFNQDGLLELIICDEKKLRIVNGSGKSHITYNDTIPVYVMETFPYEEVTVMQYPVIVDADDDGSAEIVSVGSNRLNFLESAGDLWAPTRKVWNQYMYNVTNVNNDLTVTRHQFNNGTIFIDPDEGVERRPFNNYFQQVTTLDQYGKPYFASPDAFIRSLKMEKFVLRVEYRNGGDNTLHAPYKIMVFENKLGGNVITTRTVNKNLEKGETTIEMINLGKTLLCDNPRLDTIVVAINCSENGGVAQAGGNQMECDIDNNVEEIDFTVYTGGRDTVFMKKEMCGAFEWNGVTYDQPGLYYQTISHPYSCDTIIKLKLDITNPPTIAIQGLTHLTVASNLWPGIYNFCVSDSLALAKCKLEWECDNPEWPIIPTDNKYWCRIIAADTAIQKPTTLTLKATCPNGCSNENSIIITAGHIYDEGNSDDDRMVYPNPASNSLTIQADMLTHIRLLDTSGHSVREWHFSPTDIAMLNVESLPRGMYFVEIKTLIDKKIKRIVLY